MTDLFFTDQGRGPPAFLLHGLFGSSTNWRAIAERLAENHRIIGIDLRNHGRSPHVDGMTYSEMAGDLAALMGKLDLDEVAMIGHSMGGKAAMMLSLVNPERVRRLVVIDIAPVRYVHDHHRFIEAMLGLDLESLSSRADADRRLTADVPDTATRQFLLQNLISDRGRYRWRVNLEALRRYMDEIMGFRTPAAQPYPGPCVFIAGAHSDYIQPAHHPVIAQWFPNARNVSIPDAGHWVHVDQPRHLLAAINEFGL
ncbi:MAG: alpha/beta fold hydrolase [Gammaproteobacteria bacterium]|nr:alpha/beta fold hydrolase [Gammaproteobacteria bacterium]